MSKDRANAILGRYNERKNSVYKHDAAGLNDKSEYEDRRPVTPLQRDIIQSPELTADLLAQIEHIAASGQSDDFEGDVGPWRATPLWNQVKDAWGRGMRRRKQPTVRDDITKALGSQ